MGELSEYELDRLREWKLYWWAVFCTPVGVVSWLAAAVCAVVLIVRPSVVLALFALGAAAVGMAALIAKRVLVHTLLSRRLGTYQGKRLGPRLGAVTERQIYRASRHDALVAIGALIDHVMSEDPRNNPNDPSRY